MTKPVSLLLAGLLIAAPCFGAEPESPRTSVPDRALQSRLVASGEKAVELIAQQQTGSSAGGATQESWVKRHPAVTGLLAGAGVGAVAGPAMFCPTNGDCDGWTGVHMAMGAGLGAGFGSLAGWVIGKVNRK